MNVAKMLYVECSSPDCQAHGSFATVPVERVGRDVLAMPRLLCELCGCDVQTLRESGTTPRKTL